MVESNKHIILLDGKTYHLSHFKYNIILITYLNILFICFYYEKERKEKMN